MAEPLTQTERRLKELEEKSERLQQAVETMAAWLVQAQTGFGQQDYEGIQKILKPDTGSAEPGWPEKKS